MNVGLPTRLSFHTFTDGPKAMKLKAAVSSARCDAADHAATAWGEPGVAARMSARSFRSGASFQLHTFETLPGSRPREIFWMYGRSSWWKAALRRGVGEKKS